MEVNTKNTSTLDMKLHDNNDFLLVFGPVPMGMEHTSVESVDYDH